MPVVTNLNNLVASLVEEIHRGFSDTRKNNPGKTSSHMCLATFAKSPSKDSLQIFRKSKSTCFVLNCGGTNWQCNRAVLDNGEIAISETLSEKSFVQVVERRKNTLEDFVSEMTKLLESAVEDADLDINVVLCLGFAQKPAVTNYGLDTSLIDNNMVKEWYINEDVKDRLIGEILIKQCTEEGIGISKFVCSNDAAMMPWDLGIDIKDNETLAPFGGVWGSGTNVGLVINNEIVNLELGRAQSVLSQADKKLFETMKRMGCALPDNPELETFVGGEYILNRMVASLVVHHKHIDNTLLTHLKDMCLTKGNSNIVSDICSTETNKEILKVIGYNGSISQEDISAIKKIALETLEQTSQLIAVMLVAVARISRLNADTHWAIPAEGAVIDKGYKVYERAMQYIKEIAPQYNLRIARDGSSKRALAAFASII